MRQGQTQTRIKFMRMKSWRKLVSYLIGYARHPWCGEKIYRPYSDFPGRCARCGSKIEETCRGPLEAEPVELEFRKQENIN